MSSSSDSGTGRQRILRLWPGVVLVLVQWLARFGVPELFPGATAVALMSAMGIGLLVILWWLFLSRAGWGERLGVLAAVIAAVLLFKSLLHQSVADSMMGGMYVIYVVPVLCLALVVWAWITQGLPSGRRWLALAAMLAVACGAWTLVRTEGMTGSADNDFAWRWAKSHEDRLLEEAGADPEPSTPAPVVAATEEAVSGDVSVESGSPSEAVDPEPGRAATAAAPAGDGGADAGEAQVVQVTAQVDATTAAAGVSDQADQDGAVATEPIEAPVIAAAWPGFRGPRREGTVPGTSVGTDWDSDPPVELWRRAVGPGWSSFAVGGGLAFTQEQRGEDEVVTAYNLETGEPAWRHRDPARFWEATAGAGPRATPTLHGSRLFVFGATGILNALDAVTGFRIWSRDVAADVEAKVPYYGFASSPLVVAGNVIVAAGGRLVAYDRETGDERWRGESRGASYSSPHLAVLNGAEQILYAGIEGLLSVRPGDGVRLWQYDWRGGVRIVQPAVAGNGAVLLSEGEGKGLRRLAVRGDAGSAVVEESWSSIRLRPYHNDFVLHGGHVYGFDGSILASVDLESGERNWKGGRYGHGQLLLLADQDLLLVLGEQGDLALVRAEPDGFEEVARVDVLQGKTWNHPVLIDDVLLVRNAHEMVALRLP